MLTVKSNLRQWDVFQSKGTWSSLVPDILPPREWKESADSHKVAFAFYMSFSYHIQKRLNYLLVHKYINYHCLFPSPREYSFWKLGILCFMFDYVYEGIQHTDIKCFISIIGPIRMWDNFMFLYNLISNYSLLPYTCHHSKQICTILPHCFKELCSIS